MGWAKSKPQTSQGGFCFRASSSVVRLLRSLLVTVARVLSIEILESHYFEVVSGMDLSQLKWLKNVRPDQGWAYDKLDEMPIPLLRVT